MAIIYFLIAVVVLVGIHEWGHFIVARIFGVGVVCFTIGFGRQFISWVDLKTGTSWGIAPLPLGGYVKLLGEKNSDVDLTVATNKAVIGKAFMTAPLYAKVLILLAGPLANIISAIFMYTFLAYHSPSSPLPIISQPALGTAAQISGLYSGDQITGLNGQLLNSWRDLQMALLTVNTDEPLKLTVLRKVKRSDGSLMNIKLNLISSNYSPVVKKPPEEQLGLRISIAGILLDEVVASGPAAQSGLKKGDTLNTVNGRLIDSPEILFNELSRYKPNNTLGLNVTASRKGMQQSFNIQPIKDKQDNYKIGIKFSHLFMNVQQSPGLVDSLYSGINDTYVTSYLTIKALSRVISAPFTSNEVGGPVAIANMANTSVQQGWTSIIAFLAGLSISIGVLNLLPVPMLDGGQIIYHLVRQTLRKSGLASKMKDEKAVSNYLNKIWSYTGVAFVLFLTLIALSTDIKTFF
jgi:regulator of sigma E protease